MRGAIIRRGKTSWRLKYDLPRDPETDERRIQYKTVRGKRADAEKELRAILSRLDAGMYVETSQVTLGDFLDNWLATKAPQSVGPKSLERYCGLVRHQIKPALGARLLQHLRPADISNWLDELVAADNLSTRSIRHAHGVLRTASIVKPPALVKKEVEILTSDQIGNVLDKLQGLSIFPIAATAIGTGARRGEIAALRRSDVDFGTATLRIERALEQTAAGIRVKQPKTAAGRRTVSLPAVTVEAIRTHLVETMETRMALGAGALPDNAYLFSDIEGAPPKPDMISDRWRDAVRYRKLPKVTFHALRHSHASALIAAGMDIVSVSKRLGHASPALTLSVYGHMFRPDDRDAAVAIDAALQKTPRCQLGANLGVPRI